MYILSLVLYSLQFIYFLKKAHKRRGITECPKIYRKSVHHLLKYRILVYSLTDVVQIRGKFWDTQ